MNLVPQRSIVTESAADTARLELLEEFLQACKEDYADRWSTFKHLDGKAMNVITVAGVFLAAVLVSFRGTAVEAVLHGKCAPGVWVLGCAILALLCATALALVALWLTNVSSPVGPRDLTKMFSDVLSLDHGEFLKHRNNLRRDVIKTWEEPIQSMIIANDFKARLVMWAQGILLLGVSCAGILLFMILFNLAGPANPC